MSDLPGLILLSLRFLLAISLYVFLAWALRILWLDLRQEKTQQQGLLSPISISITDKDNLTVTHVLTDQVHIIGRAVACDINLSDETVSSQHARIYYESSQWWIEDLGSSNGTFINDVFLTQPTVLADKDVLLLGNVQAEVEFMISNKPANQPQGRDI